MCKRCDKEVIEMGILESDLPNLPYQVVKWQCMAPGCFCTTTIRDYGIAPFYWWPVRIIREEKWTPHYDFEKNKMITKHVWRGGWFDASDHGRLCSKHWTEDWPQHYRKFIETGKQLIDLIIQPNNITKKANTHL